MVKEGFPVLPPVYFALSITIETSFLVQKIYCAGGVPVTVHTLFWLAPWIIRALDGEILIESTAVDKKIKYIIYKMANCREMKHIDKEVW